jgi:hypothetical protein
MGNAVSALVASYSKAEQAVLLDFITKAITVLESATQQLRQG